MRHLLIALAALALLACDSDGGGLLPPSTSSGRVYTAEQIEELELTWESACTEVGLSWARDDGFCAFCAPPKGDRPINDHNLTLGSLPCSADECISGECAGYW